MLGPETLSNKGSTEALRLDKKKAVAISRSTFIRAPAERLFEIISKQLEETPDWDPTMTWVDPISKKHVLVGSMSRVTFSLDGTIEEAVAMIRSVKPNRALLWTSNHSSQLQEEWQLQPEPLGTVITVTLSYNPGGRLLGRLTDRLLVRGKVEKAVEEMLERLRAATENKRHE